MSSDIPVVTYITPTLAGFSAGVSFNPGVGARTVNEDTTLHNRWQVALAYNGELSGVGIGADVSYITADYGNATAASTIAGLNDDMETWRGGLVLSYAGFQFGGSYLQSEGYSSGAGNAAAGNYDVENTVWDLGVAYETGPYGVSLTYAQVDRDLDNAAGAEVWDGEYQQVSLHGAYTMGPGIKLVGAAFWADAEQDVAGTTVGDTDADGTGAVVGLQLTF